MLMPIRIQKLRARLRAMSTPELLDRVTVLASQMDPEALELMHAELARRGVGPDDIGAHLRDQRLLVVRNEIGEIANCSTCGRAALTSGEEWYRLLGLLPLLRRRKYYCAEHTPR